MMWHPCLAPSMTSEMSRGSNGESRVKGPRPLSNLRVTTEFDVKEKLLAAISEELGVVASEEVLDTESNASGAPDHISVTSGDTPAVEVTAPNYADLSLCSSAVVDGYTSPALPTPLIRSQPLPPPTTIFPMESNSLLQTSSVNSAKMYLSLLSLYHRHLRPL
ncbi:hypothetical protein BC829DRAFT_255234 [Chytridium lagenaria]|nr:hypothetical protein BC829DRAFT_255234 [Chytridium lagenaria]